jgi:hypothetical protein
MEDEERRDKTEKGSQEMSQQNTELTGKQCSHDKYTDSRFVSVSYWLVS